MGSNRGDELKINEFSLKKQVYLFYKRHFCKSGLNEKTIDSVCLPRTFEPITNKLVHCCFVCFSSQQQNGRILTRLGMILWLSGSHFERKLDDTSLNPCERVLLQYCQTSKL